jgi:hypothetical protein
VNVLLARGAGVLSTLQVGRAADETTVLEAAIAVVALLLIAVVRLVAAISSVLRLVAGVAVSCCVGVTTTAVE